MKFNYIITSGLAIILFSLVVIKSCNSQSQHFLNGSVRKGSVEARFDAQADCLFCKIVAGTEQAKIIAENTDVLVFETIRPHYPSHWLIIPKKHIPHLKSAQSADTMVLGKLLAAAGALANQLEQPQAFNLAINEGAQAGQTIFHVHVHLYSDSKLITNSPKI